ncbi:MAG: hypothetical protein RXQ77_03320 [Candidatus Nanopusillus sp.]
MQYRLEGKLHLDNISYYYYIQMVNYKERIFDNENIINFMKKQIQSSIILYVELILNIREKIEKAVRKIEKMIKNE